jgi:hypothetical protein
MLFTRELPDGRRIDVYPLIFDRARLGLAAPGDLSGYLAVW